MINTNEPKHESETTSLLRPLRCLLSVSQRVEQLKPFLMVGKSAIPYAEAAAKHGQSEGAMRTAVHRLRRRYRELVREEISQTLSDVAQVEEEMRTLFAAFG